ncbi:MAG: hypothetical protein KDC35_17375 [Acidobacteria bacterium]|nr:hypothetical protein [Acidobacteriota bacterium]
MHSPWIKELQAINSVHDRYNPAYWHELHHYILGFHDSTFECVARGFSVEKLELSFSEALTKATNRILEY